MFFAASRAFDGTLLRNPALQPQSSLHREPLASAARAQSMRAGVRTRRRLPRRAGLSRLLQWLSVASWGLHSWLCRAFLAVRASLMLVPDLRAGPATTRPTKIQRFSLGCSAVALAWAIQRRSSRASSELRFKTKLYTANEA